ncbi:MAG: fructose-bisphosphate aldolase class [Rhizobacter sp.]|nr:fructose-bisphosphate aldolase class [Rhizobacter sp.]
MRLESLASTARALVAPGKGLLAMDESTSTCNERFARAGIAQTVDARRAWRDLIVTTPGLGRYLNGAILVDETIHQSGADGTPFVDLLRQAGVLVGIKVDQGAKALPGHPGETVTEGLDGLRERLDAYLAAGASFAKWRGVIRIGGKSGGLPSAACLEVNAHALARYAALCQDVGLVPIVEPEVIMDGDHSLQRCAEVTEAVQREVFAHLARQGVALECMVLKPNMVLAGADSTERPSAEEVAQATLTGLLRAAAAALAGVAFLSGGQSGAEAVARLSALKRLASSSDESSPNAPGPLTFSFSRATQYPALDVWAGDDANRAPAQAALLERLKLNVQALSGT